MRTVGRLTWFRWRRLHERDGAHPGPGSPGNRGPGSVAGVDPWTRGGGGRIAFGTASRATALVARVPLPGRLPPRSRERLMLHVQDRADDGPAPAAIAPELELAPSPLLPTGYRVPT